MNNNNVFSLEPTNSFENDISNDELMIYNPNDKTVSMFSNIITGFSTIKVDGRNIVPKNVSATERSNGSNGATVKYTNYKERQFKIEYKISFSTNYDRKKYLNQINGFINSNKKIYFTFYNEQDYYYSGYITAVDDFDLQSEKSLYSSFTITCYDPFQHAINDTVQVMDNLNQGNNIAFNNEENNAEYIFVRNDDLYNKNILHIGIFGLRINTNYQLVLRNRLYYKIADNNDLNNNEATYDDSTETDNISLFFNSGNFTNWMFYFRKDDGTPFHVNDANYRDLYHEYNNGRSTFNTDSNEQELVQNTDMLQRIDMNSDLDNWTLAGRNNVVGIIDKDHDIMDKTTVSIMVHWNEVKL